MIVDPAIVNVVGHPRRLAGQLSSYFLSRNFDVSILTSSSYTGPDFEACRTLRLFDQSSYRKSSAQGSFVSILSGWMSRERKAGAIFLYPTVTPVLAQEIAQFIAVASPESVHVPVLLLDVGLAGPAERPTVVDEETVAQYRSALAAFAEAANRHVILAVPSRTLVAYVRSISPLPVREVAPPLSIGTAAGNEARVRDANAYELGLYQGGAAPYKGFSHLPAVIGRIGAATGPEWANVRVHVQVFGANSYAREISAVAAAVTKAPFAARFSVYNSHLEDADYEALLRSLDAAVLAYDPQKYAGKTSGLFWELKSLGVPVAIPDGTWMAREAPFFPGVNVPIVGFGAEVTFAATRRLVTDRPRPAREGIATGGPAKMAQQILEAIAELFAGRYQGVDPR